MHFFVQRVICCQRKCGRSELLPEAHLPGCKIQKLSCFVYIVGCRGVAQLGGLVPLLASFNNPLDLTYSEVQEGLIS